MARKTADDQAVPSEEQQPVFTAPAPLKQAATIEDYQAKHNPPLWLHLAAKAGNGWPIGAEVSEEQYLAALKEAGNVTIGH